MFKKTVLASLFILALGAASALAEVKSTNLTNVAFDNGSFISLGSGQWSERRYNYARAFDFKELSRDKYTVLLRDDSRGVHISLNMYDKTIYYQDRNNPDWRALYKMTWVSSDHETLNLTNTRFNVRPNLYAVWNSDFGSINWSQQYYDNTLSKTLKGRLEIEQGKYVFRGNWGRTADPSSGGYAVFEFSQDGKSFAGNYKATDGSWKPWKGFVIQ